MCRLLGSVDDRGSSCVVMFMPDERAVGGRKERKSRADLDRAEKGLKRVVTSVMKRVIIFGFLGRFLVPVRKGLRWTGELAGRGVWVADWCCRRKLGGITVGFVGRRYVPSRLDCGSENWC
jgi:hypothetical protein